MVWTGRHDAGLQLHIHLVVLSLRDPIVAHEVFREGTLLLDADPARRIDFTSDALSRYLDWAPRYEEARRRSLEANRAWAKAAKKR